MTPFFPPGGIRDGAGGEVHERLQGERVPPGWSEFHAQVGGATVSRNGDVDYVGDKRAMTGLIGDFAAREIREANGPLFLYAAPRPPHATAVPTEEHEEEFAREPAEIPKGPSYAEEDVSDKPGWVARKEITPELQDEIDQRYQRRLANLADLDDFVAKVFAALEEKGLLENTYVIFTSDNGFHMGEHGLPPQKGTAYEEDIRVPLLVRGPGVPEGIPGEAGEREQLVVNNDFAPTFAELAGTDMPEADGRSLVPLLDEEGVAELRWRTGFLVEKRGPSATRWEYAAIRTDRYLYVDYRLPDRDIGASELYDLREDPYQLENLAGEAASGASDLERSLSERLLRLEECRGEGCRRIEGF